eukprot:Rmarinus@m.1072
MPGDFPGKGRREYSKLPSDEGFSSGSGEDGGHTQILQEQDSHLDTISLAVGRIGQMGGQIRDELTSQTKAIEEFELQLEETGSKLQRAQAQVKRVIKETSKTNLGVIIFLVILLIILIFLVIYT